MNGRPAGTVGLATGPVELVGSGAVPLGTFAELVESFCRGQEELRARLALAGANRPSAGRTEVGGRDDGQA